VLLASLLRATTAFAHERSPLDVWIETSPRTLVARLRYEVAGGEAARELREQFDRDADGVFAPAEREALEGYLVGHAQALSVGRFR
jgi:hypothetical protein